MTQTALRADGLSKLYRIGLRERRHETLAGAGFALLKAPWANLRRLRSLGTISEANAGDDDVVWALRDVSFEVPMGAVLGVVGANGSGKSTLLKVLSGITDPTAGRAEIRGRVASLLEVGTGFHPELTGRENVYLNGTILGMTKAEVDRRFDEIVAFSGVERFIDTPVKRYSSGMSVRLAFAVAAHLEPEILLVDEVLAVGDALFQQRCLDRMAALAASGRTLVFVSHNLAAVSRLCTSGLLLAGGTVAAQGSIFDVIAAYTAWSEAVGRGGEEPCDGDGVVVGSPIIEQGGTVGRGEAFSFDLRLSVQRPYWNVVVQVGINTPDGRVLMLASVDTESCPDLGSRGVYELRARVPGLWLAPQSYPVQVKVIASPGSGETRRYYSPWVHLDVTGEPGMEAHPAAILAPRVEWACARVGQAGAGEGPGLGPADTCNNGRRAEP